MPISPYFQCLTSLPSHQLSTIITYIIEPNTIFMVCLKCHLLRNILAITVFAIGISIWVAYKCTPVNSNALHTLNKIIPLFPEIKWTLILKSTHQCIHLEVNRVKLWFNLYLFKKMLPRVLPTLINLS